MVSWMQDAPDFFRRSGVLRQFCHQCMRLLAAALFAGISFAG